MKLKLNNNYLFLKSSSTGCTRITKMSFTDSFLTDTVNTLTGKTDIIPRFHTYDKYGATIFSKVNTNPDFYFANSEKELLNTHVKTICEIIGPKCLFFEYGCGDCKKSFPFLDNLKDPVAFVGLDIDGKILKDDEVVMAEKYPHIRFITLEKEFCDSYELPSDLEKENRRVYYMSGSNLGILEEHKVKVFLKHMSSIMGSNGYLICAFDYYKPREVIEKAYKTAEMEELAKNLLSRMNRELGANVKVEEFTYKPVLSDTSADLCLDLIANSDQEIKIKGETYKIKKGQKIKSRVYKHKIESIEAIAASCGLKVTGKWMDSKKLAVALAMEKAD